MSYDIPGISEIYYYYCSLILYIYIYRYIAFINVIIIIIIIIIIIVIIIIIRYTRFIKYMHQSASMVTVYFRKEFEEICEGS